MLRKLSQDDFAPDDTLNLPGIALKNVPAWVAAVLLCLALMVVFALIGGTRPVFSLPAYSLVGLACIVGTFSTALGSFKVRLRAIILLLLLASYLILRGIYSPYHYLALQDMFLVLACCGIYLLMVYGLVSQNIRLAMVWLLLVIAVINFVIGIIQFRAGNNFMLFGFERPAGFNRASGLFISGNHLAGYLEIVLMLGLGLTFWGRMSVFAKIICGYICLLCLGGIIISMSRGGYLSTLGGLLVFGLLSLLIVFRAQAKKYIVIALICMVGLSAAGFGVFQLAAKSPVIQQRIENIVNQRNNRFGMWEAAFLQFFEAPVFGRGAKSFEVDGRKYRPFHEHSQRFYYATDPVRVHSDYIQILGEYGVVGLGLALLTIAAHASMGLKNIRSFVGRRLSASDGVGGSNSLALQVGGVAALGAMVFHSMVDFNMHIPGNAMVMALVLGILASPANERLSRTSILSNRRLVPMALLVLCGGAALFFAPKRIVGEYFAEKARVAVRDKEWSRALDYAGRGIKSMDDNPYLHNYLGQARLFSAASAASPGIAGALYRTSARHFEQGLKLFPDDVWALILQGQAYSLGGMPEQAEAALSKAIELDPNSGQPYYYMALNYEWQGEYELAKQYYRLSITERMGAKNVWPKLQKMDRLIKPAEQK